jgi:polyhydroxybutyrate depolymerase
MAAMAAHICSANPAAADGCGSDVESGIIALGVGPYTVLAYVPESALGKPAPLVIDLHPSGSKGVDDIKDIAPLADEEGFVLLAPTGVVGPLYSGWTWNVPGVPAFTSGAPKAASEEDGDPTAKFRDDVEFIGKAIDQVIEKTCIDTNRIYAMGFSGGARMASQLACDMSDRIASVVALSGLRFPKASDKDLGLPYAEECAPERPIAVQAIHGKWDPVNVWASEPPGESPFKTAGDDPKPIHVKAPVEGTSWAYSGETALKRWVEFSGCDPDPVATELAEGVTEYEYQNCKGGKEVSLVFYEMLGHLVSGHEKPWAPGQAAGPIDGYALAWDLLKDDRLDE